MLVLIYQARSNTHLIIIMLVLSGQSQRLDGGFEHRSGQSQRLDGGFEHRSGQSQRLDGCGSDLSS
jgi:hypothetical protein